MKTDRYQRLLSKYRSRELRAAPGFVRPPSTDIDREKAKIRMRRLRQADPEKYRRQNREWKARNAHKVLSDNLKRSHDNPFMPLTALGGVSLSMPVYDEGKTLGDFIASSSASPDQILMAKERFLFG